MLHLSSFTAEFTSCLTVEFWQSLKTHRGYSSFFVIWTCGPPDYDKAAGRRVQTGRLHVFRAVRVVIWNINVTLPEAVNSLCLVGFHSALAVPLRHTLLKTLD